MRAHRRSPAHRATLASLLKQVTIPYPGEGWMRVRPADQPRSPTTADKIERFYRSLRPEFLTGKSDGYASNRRFWKTSSLPRPICR